MIYLVCISDSRCANTINSDHLHLFCTRFVMSKLVHPPTDFANEAVCVFVDLIKKRLFYLVAKKEAYSRAFQAQISNNLIENSPASTASQFPKAAEIGIRAGVRLIISLLRRLEQNTSSFHIPATSKLITVL